MISSRSFSIPLIDQGRWLMSDLKQILANTISTIAQISKQANTLGTALQNAAPGDGQTTHSVQYLLEISDELEKINMEYQALMEETFGPTGKIDQDSL